MGLTSNAEGKETPYIKMPNFLQTLWFIAVENVGAGWNAVLRSDLQGGV